MIVTSTTKLIGLDPYVMEPLLTLLSELNERKIMEDTLLHGPYSEHVDKDCWRSHEMTETWSERLPFGELYYPL